MIKLSIVIPTRNRSEYAIPCLRSLCAIRSQEVEFVVNDNSDHDKLGKLLMQSVSDCRIRYSYESKRLSITENCDQGIERSTGEYVALIGDDDGVNPDIIDVVERCRKNKIDALVPSNLAHYLWPDLRQKYYGAKNAGTMTIKPFTGQLTKRDVDAGLSRLLRGGALDLVDSTDLPKLYYGIVSKRSLDIVKAKTGTYFPGVSPDMSACVALACCVQTLWSLDYPIFLPGSSARSGAGASARKEHIGRLENQPHLSRRFLETWPISVPPIYTVQTVWAASAARALCEMGREDLLKNLNVIYLHAHCAVLNPSIRREVFLHLMTYLRGASGSRVSGAMLFWWGVARTWLKRGRYLFRKLVPITAGPKGFSGEVLNDIEEAVEALIRHVRSKDSQFGQEESSSVTRNAPVAGGKSHSL